MNNGLYDNIFIAIFGYDMIMQKCFHAFARRYNIPLERCINFSKQPVWGAMMARGGCLSGVTLSSKLLIIAHGTRFSIDIGDYVYTCEEFAVFLKQWGLRFVGKISFKSCYIGAADFLERFNTASDSFMKIGEMTGYKNTAYDTPCYDNERQLIGWTERLLYFATCGSSSKRPDSKRKRSVHGNSYHEYQLLMIETMGF